MVFLFICYREESYRVTEDTSRRYLRRPLRPFPGSKAESTVIK